MMEYEASGDLDAAAHRDHHQRDSSDMGVMSLVDNVRYCHYRFTQFTSLVIGTKSHQPDRDYCNNLQT